MAVQNHDRVAGGNTSLFTKVITRDELALRHNARTARVWFKVVGHLDQGNHSPGGNKKSLVTARSNRDEFNFTGGLNSSQDHESDWETEGSQDRESDWGTEEEWEEGFMLNAAVDLLDVDCRNPHLSDPERCTSSSDMKIKDYEESYWEHVYSRVIWPRARRVEKA
jgi:hypothetical protein